MVTAPTMARPGYPVQHAVAAAAGRQDGRRDPWRDGKRKGAGQVEHAEILGGVVLVRQHADNEGEGEVEGEVEGEAADGHADEKPLKLMATAITNIAPPAPRTWRAGCR
jgi:hypothetical protein